MLAELALIPGGIGLFLLGMHALSEGLRALAGPGLRAALGRGARSPLRGVVAGALATAVVQSSSVVTVTVVGFVGAGLIGFPQAVGLIFGANIGTTLTGWIVALVGFKLQLGLVAPPALLLAMLARLAAPGRWRDGAWALAGFCVLLMGLDMLQTGMARVGAHLTPAQFPDDSLPGRLALVGLGVAVTLVTQSSSAGVATALAALGAGAITLPQAAAMVIGMDVGTTFTAALATVGGSTAMRRTGLAHVVYNLMTGAMAFALLDPFALAVAALGAGAEPQVALVAFHSGFNILGVALALPFAGRFARLIERLAPERRPRLAGRLDPALTEDPAAAADAAAATARDVAQALSRALAGRLAGALGETRPREALAPSTEALEATGRFLEASTPRAAPPAVQAREADVLHALDHLARLSRRIAQDDRIAALGRDRRLARLARALLAALDRESDRTATMARLHALALRWREPLRAALLRRAAAGALTPAEAGERLDALRWLQRVAYHLWRVGVHLDAAQSPTVADGTASRPTAGLPPPHGLA